MDDDKAGAQGTDRRPIWAWSLHRRTQFLLDLGVLVGAFVLAYLLRFDFEISESYQEYLLIQLPMVVLVQFCALYLARIYTFVWRYVSMREVLPFLRAAAYAAAPVLLLRFGLPDAYEAWRVPLGVIGIDTVLAFGGLLGLRVLRRMLYERFERDHRARREAGGEAPSRRRPVLLVGAGRAGVLAVREIQGRGDMDIEPLGFVDDDPLKQGMVIHGVEVLGTTRDIPRLARELSVDHVILTIADAAPEATRRIVDLCQRELLKVRTIPGLYEVLAGKVSISRFRDVAIEDLLGRDPVQLDEALLERFLSARRVMVTGAGGSIGSELARQIARFRPASLLLLERSEGALFDIHREVAALWPRVDARPVLGDVCDEHAMERLLAGHRPQVVFHAAAHKHVPLMEIHPLEAVKNNVFGTQRLGRLAARAGVDAFILVSTDKAVRPTSVMGASKRLAELVVQRLHEEAAGTHFLAVRFGNVLDSTGSVIRIFREQIADGGPVTVTHPEMRRYFMTIPEAAQLVIQAGAMGEGGEIFVLDMGEPVRILELAEKMIRLSGFEPGRDVKIAFSGVRPGEKLFEEIELDGEGMGKTRHPKIFVGRFRPYPPQRVESALERLAELARDGDAGEVLALLAELLPEASLGPAAGMDVVEPTRPAHAS